MDIVFLILKIVFLVLMARFIFHYCKENGIIQIFGLYFIIDVLYFLYTLLVKSNFNITFSPAVISYIIKTLIVYIITSIISAFLSKFSSNQSENTYEFWCLNTLIIVVIVFVLYFVLKIFGITLFKTLF